MIKRPKRSNLSSNKIHSVPVIFKINSYLNTEQTSNIHFKLNSGIAMYIIWERIYPGLKLNLTYIPLVIFVQHTPEQDDLDRAHLRLHVMDQLFPTLERHHPFTAPLYFHLIEGGLHVSTFSIYHCFDLVLQVKSIKIRTLWYLISVPR